MLDEEYFVVKWDEVRELVVLFVEIVATVILFWDESTETFTVKDDTCVFDEAVIDEVEIIKDAAYVTEGAKEVFDESRDETWGTATETARPTRFAARKRNFILYKIKPTKVKDL